MIRARSSLALTLMLTLAASSGAIAAPSKAPAAAAAAEASALPKDVVEQETLAEEALHKGDPKTALRHAKAALAAAERRLGRDHVEVALLLVFMLEIQFALKDPAGGEAGIKRAIAIFERAAEKDPTNLVRALSGFAAVLESRGEYNGAISHRLRGSQMLEKARGPNDPQVIRGLRILAHIYEQAGQPAMAKPILQRILALFETIPDMPAEEIANLEVEIGNDDFALGEYVAAEARYRRALTIRRGIPNGSPLGVAVLMNNLGEIAFLRGDYPTAEPLFEEALRVFESEGEKNPADIGAIVGNLGSIALERGDHERAITLLKRALELREKLAAPDSVHVAAARANLGEAYMRAGDISAAAPLFEQALEARQKALDPEHPLIARSLDALATLRGSLGRSREAITLFERAIALREKALGPDHPEVADSLYNLAITRAELGEYKEAAPLYERVIAIREKAVGPRSPGVAQALHAAGVLHMATGEAAIAQKELERAADIVERHAGLVLAVGSERERVAYLSTITPLLRTTVDFSLAAKDAAALDLALTFVLRHKGRALDAVADSMGALRKRLSPEDQALLGRLRDAQKELSALALRTKTGDASARALMAAQEAKVERLEAEISARSAQFRVLGEPVRVSDVRAALPEGSALCEIIEAAPFPPRVTSPEPAHYVAYILRREGPVEARDLGQAAAIDDLSQKLRQALMTPGGKNREALAREVYTRVMEPLEKALGGARSVFLSPDGQLNLIPFEALIGADGRPLVERTTFTYLTSGRDLLRGSLRRPSRSGPVVIANPDFGGAARASGDASPSGAPGSRGARIGDLARVHFTPLPGTAAEGKAIGSELRGAALHEGAGAAKSVVTRVAGPRILHIATHGFFLGSTDRGGSSGSRGLVLEGGPSPTLSSPSDNPLLRSGIAFVGANQPGAEKADGILTALEASGLDLDGTKVVALSACETGVGEVHSGEGVYGLRRSLVIAGAETVLMSLWKVDDDATRDLMVSYYHRLEAGEGRSEALRAVRLAMMKEKGRDDPFYWASFIVSGDPTPIERSPGRAPTPVVVPPSARGCTCRVGDGAEPVGSPWISLSAVGFAWLAASRRRRTKAPTKG